MKHYLITPIGPLLFLDFAKRQLDSTQLRMLDAQQLAAAGGDKATTNWHPVTSHIVDAPDPLSEEFPYYVKQGHTTWGKFKNDKQAAQVAADMERDRLRSLQGMFGVIELPDHHELILGNVSAQEKAPRSRYLRVMVLKWPPANPLSTKQPDIMLNDTIQYDDSPGDYRFKDQLVFTSLRHFLHNRNFTQPRDE